MMIFTKELRQLHLFCIFLTLLLFCHLSIAGVFSVSPVRMYLTPEDRAIAVTITNESNQALVMQADIYQWSQTPSGEDKLVLTEDLFLAPPIIKLAPKKRQVVRLAVLNRAQANKQGTYRMIVKELPQAKPTTNPELEIALAFSMPVFITPKSAKSDLQCSASTQQQTVIASCKNHGDAYTHIRVMKLLDINGETIGEMENGGYLLPEVMREYSLQIAESNSANQAKTLRVNLDDGSNRDFAIVVAP